MVSAWEHFPSHVSAPQLFLDAHVFITMSRLPLHQLSLSLCGQWEGMLLFVTQLLHCNYCASEAEGPIVPYLYGASDSSASLQYSCDVITGKVYWAATGFINLVSISRTLDVPEGRHANSYAVFFQIYRRNFQADTGRHSLGIFSFLRRSGSVCIRFILKCS